jgi:replicative DNA helicase
MAEDEILVPPSSLQAEQSVLGGLLLDNRVFDQVIGVISPTDFYRFDHRLIFQAISHLLNSDLPADVLTVFEVLKNGGKDQDAGGLAYLNTIATNTPSTANVRRYAEIVREKSVLRTLIEVGQDMINMARQPEGLSARDLIEKAEKRIFELSDSELGASKGLEHINPALRQTVERLDELYHREDQSAITGLATGFNDLDEKTSGLQPGDLVVVAGRPSSGKTSFAMNIGENVAIEQNLPVAVFSMEMGSASLALRMIGSIGRIDQSRLRTARLDESDWPRISHAVGALQDAPIYIDETPAQSPMQIRSQCRKLKRRHGKLGAVIVDYLQLMGGTPTGEYKPENRATEISMFSRSLKALAKEMDCPVIALSQLNRSLEQRPNKRPIMSDLRESGAIEQDADLILFIYRDEMYNPDTQDKGIAEIIIGKQRNGPIGTVRVAFAGQHTKFDNFIS